MIRDHCSAAALTCNKHFDSVFQLSTSSAFDTRQYSSRTMTASRHPAGFAIPTFHDQDDYRSGWTQGTDPISAMVPTHKLFATHSSPCNFSYTLQTATILRQSPTPTISCDIHLRQRPLTTTARIAEDRLATMRMARRLDVITELPPSLHL